MNDRNSRQSFLGDRLEYVLSVARIGIVGLGGGGSQIVQQLAHIGFKNFVLYDGDVIEDSNLTRLVGGTVADAKASRSKIEIAERLILSLQPEATVEALQSRWQQNPLPLRRCDAIIAGLDGFAERRELEVCARRYLIPLIDIGMDIQPSVGGQPPRMAGQVFLSMPGDICMTCVGILNDRVLGQEAAQYGAAGIRPQVIWPNAILASTAISIVMDLLLDWTKFLRSAVYLSYDGNARTVQPHPSLPYLPKRCAHFTDDQVGDPVPRPL